VSVWDNMDIVVYIISYFGKCFYLKSNACTDQVILVDEGWNHLVVIDSLLVFDSSSQQLLGSTLVDPQESVKIPPEMIAKS